jgi:TonB family protein
LANLGISTSKSVVLSNGSGSGGGIGQGKGGGVGTGNGNGVGPGSGGNTGGGIRRVGDGVTAPKAIYQPEAEFSDEARRAKYEGTVVVTLIVDANGNPQNVHVSRTLGMGLDEKAVEAVQKYKFKPAIDQSTGKGVPVMVSVEVRFRLY